MPFWLLQAAAEKTAEAAKVAADEAKVKEVRDW